MADVVASFVGQTSTSTGTGDIVLSGSIALHDSFSAKMSIGDTAEIVVRDDANGAWLRCIATYSATNTLTRTTFKESSTGSNVSFSVGTKSVYLCGPIFPSGGSVGNVLTWDGSAWGGSAPAVPKLEFVSTSGAISSGTASVSFTSFASGYDYFVVGDKLQTTSGTDDTLFIRLLVGASWSVGACTYGSIVNKMTNTGSLTRWGEVNDTAFQFGISRIGVNPFGITAQVFNPASTTGGKLVMANASYKDAAGDSWQEVLHGIHGNSAAVGGIRFQWASGNFAAGTLNLYRVARS